MIASDETDIYRSSDAGMTWTRQPHSISIASIDALDMDASGLYATGDAFTRSTDSGATWSDPIAHANYVQVFDSTLFAYNYRADISRDFGKTWQMADDGLTLDTMYRVEIGPIAKDGGKLAISTLQGVYFATLPPYVRSVAVQKERSPITIHEWNSGISISFGDESLQADVEIYNSIGALVWSRAKCTGSVLLPHNALASGTYNAVIRGNAGRFVEKLSIVR